MLVSQGARSLSHRWSREQGCKVSSRDMPAEILWSGSTKWKRRRSHVKVGVGQTEGKLVGLREVGAERNMKSQGRQGRSLLSLKKVTVLMR